MFKGLGNMQQLLQQAQQMSKKMSQMREEINKEQASASAGGGAVEATLNGRFELIELRIDPQVLSDGDAKMVQDLVMSAVNEASRKIQGIVESKVKQVTGGVPIPGLF